MNLFQALKLMEEDDVDGLVKMVEEEGEEKVVWG